MSGCRTEGCFNYARAGLARTTPGALEQELETVERAEREAAMVAGTIAGEVLCTGAVQEVRVEVRDGHRKPVLAVTVRVEIERVTPYGDAA